jgi:catechol 2,3-dioxygenase-like lactoylglutathione lyase family enzyme
VPLTLDHIVIACRDLDAAQRDYVRLLGREPSWRGRHPSYGTANVLFRLNNCYIELLAPDPDADADSDWKRTIESHSQVGPFALALGTDDLDATVATMRERGVVVADPGPGSGVDLMSGAERRWRSARMTPETTRGVRAFFIQHDSSPDALPPAQPADEKSSAQGVDHTVIASSDLAATLALWQDTFGIEHRLSVERPGGRTLHFLRFAPGSGPRPDSRRSATARARSNVEGYGSILELAGETSPAAPGPSDRLWGISYRVADLAATVERLRSEGVNISDVRTGNAPGTLVADVKPGFSQDVPTLFIQR